MSNVKKKSKKKRERRHTLTRSKFINNKLGRFGAKKNFGYCSAWVNEKIEKIEKTGGK